MEPTAAPQQTAAPVELSAEQLEKRAGTYFSARRAASRQITYADGRLRFQGFDLVPLSENLFFFEVEPRRLPQAVAREVGPAIEVAPGSSSLFLAIVSSRVVE